MILSIQGVTFTYPGGSAPVLRDLDLEVPQGAFLALIGNNGSGKTSLCKLLTGLIPHFFQGDFSGTVRVNGQDALETRVAELARHVGYVYQDFENQLLKPRVLEDVAFAPLNFGLPDYLDRAEKALQTMGLTALRDRVIWELSGGEQHLVALAGALALEPEIVVVDEPVSQLDPVNAETIYDRLSMLNHEMNKTVIVIEHHPEFIAAYCDSVALLHEGHVVWHLPVRDALSRIDELERNDIFGPQVTRIAYQLAGRQPHERLSLPINLEEGVAYLRDRVGHRAISKGELYRAGSTPERPSARAVVALNDVSYVYRTLDGGEKKVLGNVDLALYEGDRVALVGANGAGKSTILRMIAGLIRPPSGSVTVGALDTRSVTPEQLADRVAFVYQDPQQMFIEDSVVKDVAYYLVQRNLPDREATVARAIQDFRLVELQDRDGRLLSGGQMRRASLAIGACMRPQVLLLDEPTSSLDVANRRQIVAMLNQLEDWVKTVVIATHDMELVAEWATRVVILQEGQVVADAPPEVVFGDPGLLDRARIRAPQVVRLSHALDIRPVCLSVEGFVDDVTGGPAQKEV